jgi:uncharacterized linocin/CFP29 family protein
MKPKSVHEPEAQVMSAAEVWDDAQQIATVVRQNLLKTEPVVRLQIPFSVFLSTLDTFSQEELIIVQRRVAERLAASP